MAEREWTLKRNCSISPKQLMQAYSALCTASLAIAVFMTLRGAWYVLGFAVVELAAVGFAFLYYARHATDQEHIVLTDDWLLVELIQAGKARQYKLLRRWIKLVPQSAPQRLIGLESCGVQVKVGRFLSERKRQQLLLELRQELLPAIASGASSHNK
jgi:uncharacterized membrane protein